MTTHRRTLDGPNMPLLYDDKSKLFSKYEVLEDLGERTTYSLFKVLAPDKSIKLWKKIDLQFHAATVETRLLGLMQSLHHPYLNTVANHFFFPDKGILFIESDYPLLTLKDRLDECKKVYAKHPEQAGSPGLHIDELLP